VGNFSNSISERFRHAKIKEGYCVICGKFGKLSQDHVPPKGSITITKVEQRHVNEIMDVKSAKVKGLMSPNGSKFKTICGKCNNEHLGKNDIEVARVNKLLTQKIRDHITHPLNNHITVSISPVKYARAMIGHILSATSVTECKQPIKESPYFDALRNFVLGDDCALDNTHDIYYWFYPFSMHISSKMVGFNNEGHFACLSLLSFYPIAFMVTEKSKGIFPEHARELRLTDRSLTLDLTKHGFEYAEFPFIELQGNRFMTLTDYQSIVSYPIKK
jgi:hypothetical protein